MSSQRGNVRRSRAQKHQNKTAFKNTLHDKSKKTKDIIKTEVSGVCARCKDIIDWKIKFKKYKPLTVPKKCVKCQQKNVKRAYYIMCDLCAKSLNLCAKCGQNEDIVQEPGLTAAEEASQQSQLEQELKMLPERKRRTFLRLQSSGKFAEEASKSNNNNNSGSDEEEEGSSYEDESSGYEDEDEDLELDVESEVNPKIEAASLATLKLIESRKRDPSPMDNLTSPESEPSQGEQVEPDLPEYVEEIRMGMASGEPVNETKAAKPVKKVSVDFTDTCTSSDNIYL